MAKEDYKGIWVFAEQQNGKLNPTVFEILAKALELKAHTGENVTAVLLGSGVKDLAPALFAYGADSVILADDPNLAQYSARPYQQALTQLSEKYKPSILLYGATSLGRDLAPRVMVSLKTGLTADAIDLGFDQDEVFYQTTPAYGGSILAHIVILEARPQMATVRPMMFEPIQPREGADGELIIETVSVDADADYEVLATAPKQDKAAAASRRKPIWSRSKSWRRCWTASLPPLVRWWTTAGWPTKSRSVRAVPPSSPGTFSMLRSPALYSIRSACRTPAALFPSTTRRALRSSTFPTTALWRTTKP